MVFPAFLHFQCPDGDWPFHLLTGSKLYGSETSTFLVSRSLDLDCRSQLYHDISSKDTSRGRKSSFAANFLSISPKMKLTYLSHAPSSASCIKLQTLNLGYLIPRMTHHRNVQHEHHSEGETSVVRIKYRQSSCNRSRRLSRSP